MSCIRSVVVLPDFLHKSVVIFQQIVVSSNSKTVVEALLGNLESKMPEKIQVDQKLLEKFAHPK